MSQADELERWSRGLLWVAERENTIWTMGQKV